jgi:cyclic pyranopterin phosphate synthase
MSPRKAGRLSHVDARGRVKMVDVGDKPVTNREAIARGTITMSREALRLIRSGAVKKGDPLQTARLAGILAAKQTSSLIPLCHPLPLSSVNVELTAKARGYEIEARVRTTSQTGVEMEALTAVAVAALTVYDMVKAVDKGMVIGDIRLMSKTGGRSGAYTRQEDRTAARQEGRTAARQEGKGRKVARQKGEGKGQNGRRRPR